MNANSGVRNMYIRSRIVLLMLVILSAGITGPVRAQIPGLPTSPAASSASPQSTVPPDPLKRETPRGTFLGFIKAAGEERYAVAIQYFQPAVTRHRRSLEEEEELAARLFEVLSRKFTGPLDFVSNDPLGRLDDGLPADQEKLGGIPGLSEDFPVYLVRAEDEQGHKLWYISRKTLDRVPEVYDTLQFPKIEKSIPKPLVENRFLTMPLWQWLALLLFVPLALLAARIVTLVGQLTIRLWRKSRGATLPPRQGFFSPDPITLAVAIFIHYWLVVYIGASILYRLYYRRVVFVLLAIAFYWVLTRITRAITHRIGANLSSRGMFAERSIVSLSRRFLEVAFFLLVMLTVLKSLGVDVTTALAGVGIGGLALGLGAQKTFENVFGGVSLLFDKVLVIGDLCKINNRLGTVEDIGLRSTRIRTLDRTMLSIPNGIMATSTIENYRNCDKFLCQQMIRLRYDLAPDHIRYVLDELRGVLERNPKVEGGSSRVRFLRFADYALEVEIYAYLLVPDSEAYLAAQETLLLQLMEVLEKTGAVVALPSQVTLVEKDSWAAPDRAKTAQSGGDSARDPGAGAPGQR
jgi:MscS family membrane protein